MITTGTMIDLSANTAFQQARHQNNAFFAQEMLRSAEGGGDEPSEKLKQVYKVIAAIDFTKAADKNARINLIQDALAMEHIYLTSDQIETHFFQKPPSSDQVKKELVDKTLNEYEWGRLAFDIMKEALEGYIKAKKTGKTREKYDEVLADLNLAGNIKKIDAATERHGLWEVVNRVGELEKLAKDVAFNQKKIDAHRAYLDAGFYALTENNWWHAAGAESKFRNAVGKDYKPQCYMRATSEPKREFQSTSTGNTTRRVVFKNSPWRMDQLAALFQDSINATFTAAGTEPPVSKLAGKDNPFHNVVFKLGEKWYIMGGLVNSTGNLILQKVELRVDGTTGKPVQGADGKYEKKLSTAGTAIMSMFSASDMDTVKNSGSKMDVSKIIEEGLAVLIDQCGFGVTTAAEKPSEEMEAILNPDGDKKPAEPSELFFEINDPILPDDPYTPEERIAVALAAWTDVLRRLVDAGEVPEPNLKEVMDKAVEAQKGVLLAHVLSSTTMGGALQEVTKQIHSLVNSLATATATATGVNRFAAKTTAAQDVDTACEAAQIAVNTKKQSSLGKALLAAPPSDPTFRAACFASGEMEIVGYKYDASKSDIAVGFVRRPDKAGAIVVEAISSRVDHLGDGWREYQTANPDKPIEVDINGRKLQVALCSPAFAAPGKVYLDVKDAADPKAVCKLTYAERAQLQKAVSVALMSAEQKAKKNVDNVTIVSPNKNDIRTHDVTRVSDMHLAATAASAPTAPFTKKSMGRF